MISDSQVVYAPDIITSNTFASGNILSNVLDLYNWHKALHSNQLLNKLSTEMMYTPHADATIFKYGYGWITQYTQYGTLVGHSGGIFGFCSIYLDYLEADTTIIVLSNLFKPVDVIARKAAEIMIT